MTTWESADGLVKKKILNAGIFSNKPTELSVCSIIINDTHLVELPIEEIKDLRSEIVHGASKQTIIIGQACSRVDRYLERAIQTMSLNEQSLITVQIPLDDQETKIAELALDITLEAVKFHKPIWEWTPEEKYESALKYKGQGVELFKAKVYIDAFHKFSKACKILITLEPINEENKPIFKNICQLKYTLYNNMAECHLIRQNYRHTITLCDKVLSKEENNVKALYRRGVAYGNLKDYEKAVNDLKTVINSAPKDKKAQEKFIVFNEQWKISIQEYKSIVRKMFKI